MSEWKRAHTKPVRCDPDADEELRLCDGMVTVSVQAQNNYTWRTDAWCHVRVANFAPEGADMETRKRLALPAILTQLHAAIDAIRGVIIAQQQSEGSDPGDPIRQAIAKKCEAGETR